MSVMEKVTQSGLILDGAMGSMLISAGLKGGEATESWVLEKPEEIAKVHEHYRDAGAQVLTSATFGANRIKLEKANLAGDMERINSSAVALAKEVAGESCFVAGNIGPTGELMAPAGLLKKDEALSCFADQATVLAEAGADLFLVQTFYDLQELLAAVEGIRSCSQLPIIATMSFQEKKSGFVTIMGNRVGPSLEQLLDTGVNVVGANCAISSSAMIRLAEEMRQAVSAPVIAQPNAGVPTLENGVATYDEEPETFAANIKKIKELGVDVVGGCCGTTPAHIEAMGSAIG